MEWWQWQEHGDSRPQEYDIKVVVYTQMTEQQLESRFPVVPEKNQDFRYLKYEDAMAYLDKHIEENVMEPVTQTLSSTRRSLKDHFAQ